MLIKTAEEIQLIKENGELIGKILEDLANLCKPGVTPYEIDKEAEKRIVAAGGKPAFKGYKTRFSEVAFPATICASVNEQIVHGIPGKTPLKDGDIFTIDIGMVYPDEKMQKRNSKLKRGFYTDTALTIPIGNVSPKNRKLIQVTHDSLEAGIAAAKPGNSVADIGRAVESCVKSQGKYGIIRDLVGHGVGHEVHEEPRIPNYYDSSLEHIILKPGMVIAIEPMLSLGGWRVVTADDGWTINMADGSRSAHFEHTIIITKTGNVVATRRPSEKI